MLQLHPNFNMKDLEGLVRPEVVDQAIDEVKEEVAALEVALEAVSASGEEVATPAGGLGVDSSR